MKEHHRIKTKVVAAMTIVLIAFVTFLVAIFYSLYNASEKNIVNIWRNQALLAGQEIGYFASDSLDALDFTAKQIDRMTADGASEKDVLAYLEEESEIYPEAVAGNKNGVYAFYNGKFLDGQGWKPDKDFSPKKRPWYLEAKAADGKLTMVTPYVDEKTGHVVTTVAKLLSDKQSVVAMDIELTDVQKIVTSACKDEPGSIAMVIDRSGFIVAHSDKKQLGKNFRNESSQIWDLLNGHIIQKKETGTTFSVREDGEDYIIFADAVNRSWITVMMLNESRILRSLRYIYLASAAALVVVILIVMAVFWYIIRKITQADQMKKLSETDQLTGINNRGGGEKKIGALMEADDSGMFILLDADHFKSVNDNFGHDVGDKVIIAIAHALRDTFRESDVVMRLGGDEFAAYANNVSDEEIGRRIIERLFANIDKIDIPELGDRPIHISVGAAFYQGDGAGFEELYQQADSGTYESKKTEGNQVTFPDYFNQKGEES